MEDFFFFHCCNECVAKFVFVVVRSGAAAPDHFNYPFINSRQSFLSLSGTSNLKLTGLALYVIPPRQAFHAIRSHICITYHYATLLHVSSNKEDFFVGGKLWCR